MSDLGITEGLADVAGGVILGGLAFKAADEFISKPVERQQREARKANQPKRKRLGTELGFDISVTVPKENKAVEDIIGTITKNNGTIIDADSLKETTVISARFKNKANANKTLKSLNKISAVKNAGARF